MTDGSEGVSDGSERRGAPRVLTCYPFHVQRGERGHSNGEEIALIRDISPTGALLFVTTELEVGTRVQLHLDFVEPVRIVEGRVVRRDVRPPGDSDVWPHRAAVHFVEPCEDLAPQIEAFSREVGDEPSG
jgi:hypothetical protein